MTQEVILHSLTVNLTVTHSLLFDKKKKKHKLKFSEDSSEAAKVMKTPISSPINGKQKRTKKLFGP